MNSETSRSASWHVGEAIISLDVNVAPDPVTAREAFQVNRQFIVAAAALGYALGTAVCSWESADVDGDISKLIFDSELFGLEQTTGEGRKTADTTVLPLENAAFQALLAGAVANLKDWAKDSQRFYNSTKLEDMVLDQLVRAFEAAHGGFSMGDVLTLLVMEFRLTI